MPHRTDAPTPSPEAAAEELLSYLQAAIATGELPRVDDALRRVAAADGVNVRQLATAVVSGAGRRQQLVEDLADALERGHTITLEPRRYGGMTMQLQHRRLTTTAALDWAFLRDPAAWTLLLKHLQRALGEA